ncbi:MAG: protein translocase SEC61 complex subunit gamma [Candidatus Aenigmatarchaeota archaeon]|nr:MAG: protein translocase SEC61 complex subunit gamma [Candidatus Aenigmarchaeota archaeon]
MKIREGLRNCIRVLKVARKPDREEFFEAAKITGLGIIVIGMIGFIIFLLFRIPTMVG